MEHQTQRPPLEVIKRSLNLTWFGLFAERVTRAFWPLWSMLMLGWVALSFGAQDALSQQVILAGLAVFLLATLWAAYYGARRFQFPSKVEALERMDNSVPGRPISSALDTQAIGSDDQASQAVWAVHVARMRARLAAIEPVSPDLKLSDRDPYALRYAALLFFAMAVTFGSVWRSDGLGGLAPTGPADAAVAGPSWEIWIEPPTYTGRPSLYLNDIKQAELAVPRGSEVTVRLYGQPGAITLEETVSGGFQVAENETAFTLPIKQSGKLSIADDRSWDITASADQAPLVEVVGEIERSVTGELKLPFEATDDYGVESGTAEITLELPAVDRRYGLVAAPEDRPSIVLDLPMPLSGGRDEFIETLVENLSEHPWVGLPVEFRLSVTDASDQDSAPEILATALPGRRFFQPVAKAVVEQRRDLLWSRENAKRVGQVLRTITYKPDDYFPSEQAYLMIRMAVTRLDIHLEYGLSVEKRDEIADLLWRAAILIEDGRLSDALKRLREAQERLSEAMKDGASDEEIAELMQELSEAMDQYMQQLAQEAEPQDQQQAQNGETITGDQLQEMMDRIQELMEQGRMDEAEQLLNELMQMMQNMQVVQGQGGEGSDPNGEAMEDLQETLRDQQELSDDAFRELQEQFNGQRNNQQGQNNQEGQQGQNGQQPGQQPGQQQGQNGEQPGQQGQGQQPGQQQGQNGQQPGQGQNQGQGQGQNDRQLGQGGGGQNGQAGSLADRQQALRDELERQRRNLPGRGTPEGDAARDSLGEAERFMDQAEDALRNDETARALGAQSDALEALREGLRNLGEALARNNQQQNGQDGQQGNASGENAQGRDPLGREAGSRGRAVGTSENILEGDDPRQRARELTDEIRKRSGDQSRPEVERDYLRRLLDRF